MLADHLEADRQRLGFTGGRVAWRLGITPQEYRDLITRAPIRSYATWDAICEVFGWPRSFAGKVVVAGGAASMNVRYSLT
jgi:Helix-turn-helix domain